MLSSGGGPVHFTADLSADRPFEGARERPLGGGGGGGGATSWASTHTQRRDDGGYRHYALFSGGRGGRSALYVVDERPDGSLGEL